MRVQRRALKKTGKDSGIQAFISVSTWEISTLYRVPLSLSPFLFPVSVEKKGMHSAACSFEDGLSDFASFLSRPARGAWWKKEARSGLTLNSTGTRYFRKLSSLYVQVKHFSDDCESAPIIRGRIITENGFDRGLFARRSSLVEDLDPSLKSQVLQKNIAVQEGSERRHKTKGFATSPSARYPSTRD